MLMRVWLMVHQVRNHREIIETNVLQMRKDCRRRKAFCVYLAICLLLCNHIVNTFSKFGNAKIPNVFHQCPYLICVGNILSSTAGVTPQL